MNKKFIKCKDHYFAKSQIAYVSWNPAGYNYKPIGHGKPDHLKVVLKCGKKVEIEGPKTLLEPFVKQLECSEELEKLKKEIEIIRQYGKDCTAMANEELARLNKNGSD